MPHITMTQHCILHTKGEIPVPSPPHKATTTSQWRSWKSIISIIVGLSSLLFLLRRIGWGENRIIVIVDHFPTPSSAEATSTDWKWSDIEPSKTLQWHRCYNETYDCARLDVPMDWLDPSDEPGRRVAIAVIRLKATELDDYKGPLFFNPGGPGGSGVYALKDRGALLQVSPISYTLDSGRILTNLRD